MKVSNQLKEWKFGPLPEPFERQARAMFSVTMPDAEWINPVFRSTVNHFRARMRDAALETMGLAAWTLDENDAAEKLAALVMPFAFGTHEMGEKTRTFVLGYCKDFVNELWPDLKHELLPEMRSVVSLAMMPARKVG